MQPSSKRVLGIFLVVVSLVTLVIAFCQVVPMGFVDFPCTGQQVGQQGIASDSRLAYCLSVWPRQAISGGGIYDIGTSNQDEIRVDPLNLKRYNLTLSVNGHEINPGQTYKTTRFAGLNPWVVLTSRFEVRNDGLMPEELTSSASVLFVTGDVHEGWFPNPLGLIVLIGGVWLIRQGKEVPEHQVRQTKAA